MINSLWLLYTISIVDQFESIRKFCILIYVYSISNKINEQIYCINQL